MTARAPTQDEAAGMAWWNALTERERAEWMRWAGSAVVADVWAVFKGSHAERDERQRGMVMTAGTSRASLTVRKIGRELNRAVEIRRALAEHDDPALILDTIEGSTDLAEAIAVVWEEILEDEILIAGLKQMTVDLGARQARLERSIETRRGVILMALEKAQLGTVKTPLATLTVKPVPPRVLVSDEARIPARFWKPQDPKLDRAALGEALKAGEAVDGASLSNGGVTLAARVR